MGCNYWECKFNNLSQRNTICDCGKTNNSNTIQPCPKYRGDYCPDGEQRNKNMIQNSKK